MMSGWNEQVYYNVLAVVFGSCALLSTWFWYHKKPNFVLYPGMKLMTVGQVFWCVSDLMKASEISHSIYRRGLSGIPGMIGAILFIIAGISVMRTYRQNRTNGKGNVAKPTA